MINSPGFFPKSTFTSGLSLALALFVASVLISFTRESMPLNQGEKSLADSLRRIYSRPSDRWPAPTLDSGIIHTELGILPDSPLGGMKDSLKFVIELGKMLFFDPRLSGSNQISCGTCHVPEMHFTDGRRIAIGHDHLQGKRNTPSLENVWFYEKLFWDGRAVSLEEQAEGPLTSPVEMNQDINKLPAEISEIKGYMSLFEKAYGDAQVTRQRILFALSIFQRTIVSRNTNFDFFLAGNSRSLTDEQILGLHIFRTKARCMNCHSGPLFTDGKFHNLGETYFGDKKYEDLGLYETTKNPDDVGKFKTPGLRNSAKTGPWFHHGLYVSFEGLMNVYVAGLGTPVPNHDQQNDPLFPKKSPHLINTRLTLNEQNALVAFLQSLSSIPMTIEQPELPK